MNITSKDIFFQIKDKIYNNGWMYKEDDYCYEFYKKQSKNKINKKFNLTNGYKEIKRILKENLEIKKEYIPLNVLDSFKNNSFVGSGLDLYYPYFYSDKELPINPSIIFQPVVRYSKNKILVLEKYKSTIAFVNVSYFKEYDGNIINDIDKILDIYSKLGVYAGNLVIKLEKNIYKYLNKEEHIIIKFYYKNIEISDILLISCKNKLFVEYGFGIERILTTIQECKYEDLYFDNNDFYNHADLLRINFISLIAMSNLNFKRGAKSIFNKIKNELKLCSYYDSLNILKINYEYWHEVIKSNMTFEDFLNNYLKLINYNST